LEVVGLELVGLGLVGAFVVGILEVGMEVEGKEEGVTVVGLNVGVELGLSDGVELGVIVSVGLMLGSIEVVGTTEEDGSVVGDAETGERLTVGDDVGIDDGVLVDGLFVGLEVGLDVGVLLDGLEDGFDVGFVVAPTEQSVIVASFIVELIVLARFTIISLTSAGVKALLLARIPTAIPATSEKGYKTDK